MIPDRLSVERHSQHYQEDPPRLRVSVDGVEYSKRVLEYCISGGWAKVIAQADVGTGRPPARGRSGANSYKMKRGKVVVWLEADPPPPGAIKMGFISAGDGPGAQGEMVDEYPSGHAAEQTERA